jgi:hypothetical protein
MILPAILDPFAKGAAPAVMTRLALDWMIEGSSINRLLEGAAEGQYDREFLLSHFVEVLGDVACGFRPSPRAAFLRRQLQGIASIRAFYAKLARMELPVSEAIVRETGARARRLVEAAGGLIGEPIPGYAARIIDGNILTGTDHRIEVTRGTRSAALPGMSLAIYEPASGVVREVILEENAHAQERSLFDRIAIAAGQLWIMDRNFCVRSLLDRIATAGAHFLARWHSSALPYEELEPLRSVGRVPGGEVFEQMIRADGPRGEAGLARLRRIVLRLDEPTRDGEAEIALITDLPPEVSAEACCRAYRGRWAIERHFQRLTDLLHCEVPTLGYPRAALFAFCMSVVAGNALAILLGNLRAAHGEDLTAELSEHALVQDIAEVYPGMMIAAPPPLWPSPSGLATAELVGLLRELAANVPVHRMLRSPRGPKRKKKPATSGRRIHHVATKKLLDEARGLGPPAKPKRRRTKG